MDAPGAAALPAWVRKRDGRLVPFDGDRICQALFAATERLGRPDAFLARELTDGILYFLAREDIGTAAPADRVAETVAKVVRELRHPDVAHAFLELDEGVSSAGERHPPAPLERPPVIFHFSPLDSPVKVVRDCLRQYTLHAAFSRDVHAVHNDGLLLLPGLEAPLSLAAAVLDARNGQPDAAVLAADGPELASVVLREIGEGNSSLRGTSFDMPRPRAIVNLNAPLPLSWGAAGADGLLFGGPPPEPPASDDVLLERLLAGAVPERVRLDWHLSSGDFAPRADGLRQRRLARLVRAALDGGPVAFTFDRPRRPVSLGAGLDREHPAVLMTVGLHLPRLADLPGVGADAELFLKKLASLTRLALSAAVQKRAFLRRLGRDGGPAPAALGCGFLLERARLLVAPIGLEEAVRRYHGGGPCAGETELTFACRIVEQLQKVLARDGGAALIEACVDAPWDFGLEGAVSGSADDVAGPTAWDASAPPRSQLRAAGQLHALARSGTAAVVLPREAGLGVAEAVRLLHFAWKQTEVARLRLVRAGRPQQASLPGL